MPADVTADLNALDAQVTTLVQQAAAMNVTAQVIVTATAAGTTQPMVDNLNTANGTLSTALQAINATRARIIRGRNQP